MDKSVDTGDIPDDLDDDSIRKRIRDKYLKDSTVTIVLVGAQTKRRKHVDWEIYSSMFGGTGYEKSGIVVINLPGISGYWHAPHGNLEKNLLYPDVTSWVNIDNRAEHERRVKQDMKISVAPWDRINKETLQFLIDAAFESRQSNAYNLSEPMKQENS